jgi:hypothetical protein
MDYAVGGRRGGRKAVEVVEVAAVGGGAFGLESGGGLVGAGQADDLVAVGDVATWNRCRWSMSAITTRIARTARWVRPRRLGPA